MRAQQARKPYTYIQFSLGQRERVLLVSKSIQGERNQTVEEIYLPATMQHPFVANRGEKFAFFAIFSLVRCSFFFSKCFFPFLSYFSFFSIYFFCFLNGVPFFGYRNWKTTTVRAVLGGYAVVCQLQEKKIPLSRRINIFIDSLIVNSHSTLLEFW